VHHEADSRVLKVSREYNSVLMLKCHYYRGASSRADGANLGLLCSCVSHFFVKQPKEEGGVRSIFPYFLACGSGRRPEQKISRRVLSCQSKHTSVRLAHQLCVSRFGTVAVDSFFLLKTIGNSRSQLVGSLRCDQRLEIGKTLSHRYSYSNLLSCVVEVEASSQVATSPIRRFAPFP
jgi:hypothetical protein